MTKHAISAYRSVVKVISISVRIEEKASPDPPKLFWKKEHKEYNEVFFMRTRDGDGCGRAAIFCNPPKNEIMGAKSS